LLVHSAPLCPFRFRYCQWGRLTKATIRSFQFLTWEIKYSLFYLVEIYCAITTQLFGTVEPRWFCSDQCQYNHPTAASICGFCSRRLGGLARRSLFTVAPRSKIYHALSPKTRSALQLSARDSEVWYLYCAFTETKEIYSQKNVSLKSPDETQTVAVVQCCYS